MFDKGEIAEPARFALTHTDLHPGNVLVDPTTLQITAILDWETSRLDVDDAELCHLGWCDDTDGLNEEEVERTRKRVEVAGLEDCLRDHCPHRHALLKGVRDLGAMSFFAATWCEMVLIDIFSGWPGTRSFGR